MSNYKTANVDVSDIIKSGTTFPSGYSGFPGYNTSNFEFEKHVSALGYKVDGVDLSNSVVAMYSDYIGGNWTTNNSTYDGNTNTNTGSSQTDNQPNNNTYKAYESYGNTVTASGTIPSWCSKVRVIVIGAGGGGGGAGTNKDSGGNRGGSGSGGGSGGVAAGTISVVGGQTFNISIGGCGRGGYYETNAHTNGYNAKDPASTSTTFTYGTSIIQANCGTAGDGGEGAGNSNNVSNSVSGGNGTVNTTNVSSYNTTKGADGNTGDNLNPGESNGITNNSNLPTLNTNQGSAPNTSIINQDNQLPGYGQGGWGGANSENNDNGYGGQCGGRSFVRVYFIR